MQNLNLLFYKTFYAKLGRDSKTFDDDVAQKGKTLTLSKFYEDDYHQLDTRIAPHKFMLKTAYPGLLAGTGYAHGVETESDVKVGFSFDFVTGQPYIPGSSVKGLLRSYFKHKEVIVELLGDSKIDVRALERSIFGSTDDDSDDGVDIFFDAVVKRGDRNGRVMGFDSITPHGEDLTKNPNPLKIVKIMPDVVLEFSFNLKNSVIGEKPVSAEQKADLFKKIITHFGIGAKTNVGYGVLTPVKENELNPYPKKGEAEPINAREHRPQNNDYQGRESAPYTNTQRAGKPFDQESICICTVVEEDNEGFYISVDGSEKKGYLSKQYLRTTTFNIGDRLKASYLYTNKGKNYFKYRGRAR